MKSSLRALAVSTGGGPSAFGVYIFSLCAGISLFDCFKWVLIDCIVKCRGHSELWQFQLGGVHLPLVSTCFLYVLVFPYLTVSNGHSLTALKSIEVTQSSGSFKGGVHLPLVSTCFLYALVFPYIFLLFDCFEWALIDCIEKCRGHSELWQFQMGGVHLPLVSTCFSLCTGISLYLPIT